MVIKIYGSGGGEGLPANFCACENCRRAHRLGGKNQRTLSQAVIDDFLLIDLGADTSRHVHEGMPLSEIGGLLFTHSHNDHCYPQILETRGAVYASGMRYPVLNIFGDGAVVKKIEREMVYFQEDVLASIALKKVEPWQKLSIGKYQVWTLAAMHAPEENALNFVISDGGRTVLYALDTGLPSEQYYEFLLHETPRLDCVIMDCTMGIWEPGWIYHMSITHNHVMKQRLVSEGLTNPECKFVASHFTHNHHTTHEDMERRLMESGIRAAYDGMAIVL